MNNNKRQGITWQGSLFLDTLRLLSALTVLYVHAHDQWYPTEVHSANQPANIAHCAVVVFFVLSGYVIAHTTTSNNRGETQYIVARLSRLYSVVLPALVITAVIEFIVKHVNSDLSNYYSRGASWPRYILTGTFFNEIWGFSAAPPINQPLWSLSFEFWYYTIFGCWFYRKNRNKPIFLPLVACLIAGPKILLMMPIWLFGFFSYRLPKPKLNFRLCWLLLITSISLAISCIILLRPFPYAIGSKPFYFANQFITDWVIGIFIATALWFLPLKIQQVKKPVWIGSFRSVADLTFPIYVLHHPFLVLWRALFNQRLNDETQMWEAILSVFLVTAVLGVMLEGQRKKWVKCFELLLGLIKSKFEKRETLLKRVPETL